jgi:hypothetical protein
MYQNFYGKTQDSEESILHALYECGVRSLGSIEHAIRIEPDRNRAKLLKLKRKLLDCYEALMTYSDEESETNTGQAQDFDNDIAFLMGDFGQELGDDYLGLKDLGVDLQSGANLPPERLWNPDGTKSKIRQHRKKRGQILRGIISVLSASNHFDAMDTEGSFEDDVGNVFSFQEVPAFPAIRDVSGVIRLMLPFLSKKMNDSGGSLIEVGLHIFFMACPYNLICCNNLELL